MHARVLWLTAATVALGLPAVEAAGDTRRTGTALSLPSYARPGADPLAPVPGVPMLTERVDVIGKPMDTEWLTAKMEWWMADFDPVYGSAPPIAGQAPSLNEMYEHRPHGPRSANLTPLLGWVAEKLSKKK